MLTADQFLIKHGQNEKARAMMVKYHANGDEADELVEWEYREIVTALQQEDLMPKSSWVNDLRKMNGPVLLCADLSS